MDRLLSYLKTIEESRPYMYNKSKLRYKDLAATCREVVDVISSILQEDALYVDEEEFDSDFSKDIATSVTDMQTELSRLASFVSSKKKDSAEMNLTVKDKKEAIHNYATVLSSLASTSLSGCSPAVSDCAKLLWYWFDIRFLQSAKYDPGFRYQVKRIPEWIYYIVVAYSVSIQNRTSDQFILRFHAWCNSLSGETKNRYAVPYEVYKISKSPECVNLTSVVLWDILLHVGLNKLCSAKEPYLCETFIYDLCSKVNPSALDDYKDFRQYPDVLSISKLGSGD